MDFTERYKSLNAAQKQAVDTLDGPVMVVAGPGTGKTELLSVRVANILKKTDALPSNILCLTYTESGALAMRERLAGLIGADAYKVAIHTFHSFGTEIINTNAEYFYQGAHFRPADELSSYEVLQEIFEKLSHDSPLGAKMNDAYTYLSDAQTAISDLKKSGLTSDELLAIIDRNEAFVEWVQPRLQKAMGDRLSKKTFAGVKKLLEEMASYEGEPLELITYEPLHELCRATLEQALELATQEDSTKPLSAWKKDWCEKREDGELTLKDAKRCVKLRALAGVYYDYLIAMQARSLYDFDDMILRVVHATEVFDDLRLNLQERYQYILVDEFQDTNDAQMRLVWNLTNNPSSEGRPNLLVVGDDDQAIYRFQGANLSNILDFRTLYRDVAVITLKDNYRSTTEILELSRRTIVQADERLESVLEGVDKTLTSHHQPKKPLLVGANYADEASEYTALAMRLAAEFAEYPKVTRAVIARNHKQLRALVPYLQAQKLPLSYDRQDNVLESEAVVQLELLARVIHYMAANRFSDANALMPELLSHPAWGISSDALWKLSLDAYKERQFWVELMLTREGQLNDIAEWLILTMHQAQHEPLEYMLDRLFGVVNAQATDDTVGETEEPFGEGPQEEYISPLRAYFFPSGALESDPSRYTAYLSALTTIRRKLREYRPDTVLKLTDFVEFIDMHQRLGIGIPASGHIGNGHDSIHLLTAHKAKGLEYDSVSVIGLSDTNWGEASRGRAKLIAFPHNLPLGIVGETSDERIRLLFVALTRARNELHLSTHRTTASGKETLPVAYLADENELFVDTDTSAQSIEAKLLEWRAPLLSVGAHTMEELLTPTLERYRLSATHLGNFLDVSRGGPELFLLQNLLRFPQAMSPSAAYGSAIHAALRRAHEHLAATGKKRPVEDVLHDFEAELERHQLSDTDTEHLSKRGSDTLTKFLSERYASFSVTQQAERSFATEAIVVDDARITGAIDLIDIDEENKTIIVTDYKTGRAVPTWKGGTEYEKIKLHHYRQQLIFYKLLIEHSRQYDGYKVTSGIIEFVEPTQSGKIERLELIYDDAELEGTTALIKAVWSHICQMKFALDHEYDPNLKGILAFEAELLKND